MRIWFSVLALLVAMGLFWVSAHDGYVSRINQHQQQLNSALQQGDYDLVWPLQSPSELIGGFGSGWLWQPEGLQLDVPTAEISWAFNQQFVVPQLHQRLSFNWLQQSNSQSVTQLLLEFSQANSDMYYYSPLLTLKSGTNHIDLSSLAWTAKQNHTSQQRSWDSLPSLNTMVWRFFSAGDEAHKVLLKDLKIQQNQPLMTLQEQPPLVAMLNNELRHQWQSQRFQLSSLPVMARYVSVPVIVIYGLAVFWMMLAVLLYPHGNQNKPKLIKKSGPLVLLAIVAALAWLMQTKTLFLMFENYPWVPAFLFVLPVLLLAPRWWLPKHTAWPIWLITLVAAAVMFGLGDHGLKFAKDLPLYVLWAISQQVILGPMVSDYLHHKAGFTMPVVAWVCGVLFALLHFPNQMLMVATFGGGVLWSYAWLRYQNIYANAISHALLALLFYQTMAPHLLGSARVGFWF